MITLDDLVISGTYNLTINEEPPMPVMLVTVNDDRTLFTFQSVETPYYFIGAGTDNYNITWSLS